MLRSNLAQKSLCLVLGAVVGIIALFVMPISAALAAPAGFFSWFKQAGSIDTGLFLWDVVVTYGLGLGLPAFMALLLAFRHFVAATIGSALAFLAGVLLTIHVLAPLWFGYTLDLAFQRPWFAYALELSLVVGVLAAMLVARFWPRPSRPSQVLSVAGR